MYVNRCVSIPDCGTGLRPLASMVAQPSVRCAGHCLAPTGKSLMGYGLTCSCLLRPDSWLGCHKAEKQTHSSGNGMILL